MKKYFPHLLAGSLSPRWSFDDFFRSCVTIVCCLVLLVLAGCGSNPVTPVTPGKKGPNQLSVAYVTNVSDNNISGYVINGATGVLTSIGGATTAGQQPFSIAITPS